MDKEKESRYGEFFKQYINKRYGFNFIYQPEKEQQTDIDGYLIDEKNGIRIYLQMKTPDKEPINAMLKTKLIDYDPTEWISNMIGEAESKYPLKQRQNLILLLTAFISPFPRSIKIKRLRLDWEHPSFRGIYYIILPSLSV